MSRRRPSSTGREAPALATLLPGAQMRTLGPQDFAAWRQLRNEVISGLAHPDMYMREDDEAAFFAQHLPPRGHCLGVWLGDELAAYAMLDLPEAGAPGHLGAAIGLAPREQAGVAHLASCMVRAPWRGNQLQALLLQLRYAMAQACHRPRCLAMVSLHNAASRHNLLAQGMWIEWTGTIDGLRRHVLQIDLRGAPRWDLSQTRLIAGDDFAQLCAAAAEGYAGVEEVCGGARPVLRYARRLPACGSPSAGDGAEDAP
ncbi:hypothetical protein [Comamonas endophytica]|uniref:N-acetyltransferase domain-containing protein n=1 Tax=Comamonas endophytica TaxID=2949090 RepID=A0ABY6GEK6_9BURK|nr:MULTISPECIES: hypothetical protein [unclassified Acidovorax]MCD2512860.1 hypothetical protein [Acidovorax sp. D4N7]UYG52792.1 hypothetical protein M9799_06010 [Acidovorax sp. 5MLIR]